MKIQSLIIILMFGICIISPVQGANVITGLTLHGVVQKLTPETGNDSLTVRDDSLWIVIDDTTRISFIAGYSPGSARLQGGIAKVMEFAIDSVFIDVDSASATPLIAFSNFGGGIRWNRSTDKMQFSNDFSAWSDIGTSSGLAAADFNDSLESQIEFSPKTHAKLDSSTAVRGAINDSLQTNWATFTAGGSAIKWRDSSYVYLDTANVLGGNTEIKAWLDTTAVRVPIADSTHGGATQATTCKMADSTDGGSVCSETCKVADSCDGGAARAEVSDSTNSPFRAAVHDSLDANWATFTAAGEGMPAADFNDSLESQADFSPNIFNRIDTTTAQIPTATLADSADGGSIRSETCKEADTTDGGATRATTSAIADSCDGGAARAEISRESDSTAVWANLVNDNRDSATTHSSLVNEAKDSLTAWANKVNDNSDDIDELETDTRYLITTYNPNSLWVADSMLVLIDTRTPAAITVTRIDVTCDADPGTELDFDLMWADAFIGNANRAVVDEMNTSSGVVVITTGFDDATIAANKCIYIRFNAEPDADMTQVGVRVTYTID